jgi:hypothetical protein
MKKQQFYNAPTQRIPNKKQAAVPQKSGRYLKKSFIIFVWGLMIVMTLKGLSIHVAYYLILLLSIVIFSIGIFFWLRSF